MKNTHVLDGILQSGATSESSMFFDSLRCLGFINNVGTVTKTAADIAQILSASKVVGAVSGVAAAGTVAALGTGTATVATIAGASALAPLAVPVAVGVGVAYGVKKIWDWFTD